MADDLSQAQRHTIATAKPDGHRWRVDVRSPGWRGLTTLGFVYGRQDAARMPGALGLLTPTGERVRERLMAEDDVVRSIHDDPPSIPADAQSAGGWPDPQRPGYPANPERDAWHWVRNQWGATVPALWLASDGWRLNGQHYSIKHAARNQHYLGPCLPPAEVAAQVAAAREAGRRGGIEAVVCVLEAMKTDVTENAAPDTAAEWRLCLSQVLRECRALLKKEPGR